MKRFFFSLTALAAVLVGCTQSAVLETPDLENIEISFNPYTGRTPVTKATEIASPTALGNAGGFNLYGTSTTLNGTTTTTKVYINDKHVNYVPESESWAYDQGTAVYWPPKTSTTTLSMAAYSANAYLGVDKTASTSDDPSFTWLNNTDKKAFRFEVPAAIGNQVDLLATSFQGDLSLNNTEKVDNGKVNLIFHHLLSRIGFQLKTIGPERRVVIKSLSFSGRMYTEGILDLTSAKESEIPALTQTTPQEVEPINKKSITYNYIASPATFATGASDATSISSSNYLMIMPHAIQPGDDHYIDVTYTIGDSSDKRSRIELPVGLEFLPGKAYEFILELSTSAITFNVEIEETGWDEPSDGNTITRPVTPTPQDDITLFGTIATTNSATFALTVNKVGFDEVGVACRVFESEVEWEDATLTAHTSATSKGTYEVVINSLSPNTTYEYCAYSKIGNNYTYYSDECPKFTTYASVTLNTITEADITFDGATLSATCSQTMDEYGFCWVKGTKTPTIADSIAEVTASAFNYTITGLESYTSYTVCAYVKNTTAGIVSYSTPQTFRTKFSVSDADYSGADVE